MCCNSALARRQDFLAEGWLLPPESTAVYLYLLDEALDALRPALQTGLARGVRVVANTFHPEFLGPPMGSALGQEGRFHLRLFARPHSA